MRRAIVLLLVLLFPTLVAAPARADAFPASVPLPVDFAPEGIAVGPGTTFWAGSLTKGDIYRGDLRSGKGTVIDVPEGRSSVGLKVDADRGLLVVAGGFGGTGYFYDLATGATRATVQLAQAGSSLINDVVVTDDAAWFTNSFAPVLYRVPISDAGAVGSPTTLPLTGPAAAIEPNFPNLNGIAATADGSRLFVAHTVANAVFSVNPLTGVTATVVGGFPDRTLDGILLQGRSLWAVANFANTVYRVTLSPDRSTGTVTQAVTSDLFRVPTTVARFGSKLVLVNARFDLGFPPPFGPGAPQGTTFDVVSVRA